MKEAERPRFAPVAGFNHGLDGVTDAAVVFDSRTPKIIESAQAVVVLGTRAEPIVCRHQAGGRPHNLHCVYLPVTSARTIRFRLKPALKRNRGNCTAPMFYIVADE